MSIRAALDLLSNPAFLERVRLRIVDRLVLGGVDPSRDPINDPIRDTLKAAVLNGSVQTDALLMAMFVATPGAAVVAAEDLANPGAALSPAQIDAMIDNAWALIVQMGA